MMVDDAHSAPKGQNAIAQGNALGMLGCVNLALKGRHAGRLFVFGISKPNH
jgi:hypothetical protein